jgi:hypothetical protein
MMPTLFMKATQANKMSYIKSVQTDDIYLEIPIWENNSDMHKIFEQEIG